MDVVATVPLADTWGMHGDVGSGWWFVMVVAMVVFWGAVIIGGAWLLRGAFESRQGPRSESPKDILERRFAEGTISVEDYRERKELLGHGAAQAEADERQAADAAREGSGSTAPTRAGSST